MPVLPMLKQQMVWLTNGTVVRGHPQKRVERAEDDSRLLLVRDGFLQALPVTLLCMRWISHNVCL